jgi:hypothetical protein
MAVVTVTGPVELVAFDAGRTPAARRRQPEPRIADSSFYLTNSDKLEEADLAQVLDVSGDPLHPTPSRLSPGCWASPAPPSTRTYPSSPAAAPPPEPRHARLPAAAPGDQVAIEDRSASAASAVPVDVRAAPCR